MTGGCGANAVAVWAATWPSVHPHKDFLSFGEGVLGLATAQVVASAPKQMMSHIGNGLYGGTKAIGKEYLVFQIGFVQTVRK